jgi:predicted Zn-dependent protease with MMP-like domain
MEELGVTSEEMLCGLYTGIPLTERSVERSGSLPDVVTIYRKGILHLAVCRGGVVRRNGQISEQELQRQIRITILHELGHHHGLSEQDLTDLGYG